MVAADIIKTLKRGRAFARLTQGCASLDTRHAAMDGAREGDAAALRAAVAAYRAALQEWTRDRVPLDWATARDNMAGAAPALFRLTGAAAEWTAVQRHAQAAVDAFSEFGRRRIWPSPRRGWRRSRRRGPTEPPPLASGGAGR